MNEKWINTKDFRKKNRFNFNKFIGLTKFEMKAVLSNKNLLVGEIITIVMYFFFFTAGLRGLTGKITLTNGQTVDYLEYAIPGIAMLLVIKMMGHTIYRSTIDKRWGLIGYKFNYGVSPDTYIYSLSVYPNLIFTVQFIILLFFGFLFGLTFNVYFIIGALLVGYVSMMFWVSMGLLITNAINDYRQRDLVLSVITLPIIFTAPSFYSLDTAPKYIQIISKFNPLTYHVTAIRSVILGNPAYLYIIISIISTLVIFVITRIIVKNTKLITKEQ